MVTDWRGKELNIGDKIVYPVRHGSSMTMNEGVIEEILSVIGTRWDYGTRSSVEVENHVLKVKRLIERCYGERGEVPPKIVTITCLGRVTKVD